MRWVPTPRTLTRLCHRQTITWRSEAQTTIISHRSTSTPSNRTLMIRPRPLSPHNFSSHLPTFLNQLISRPPFPWRQPQAMITSLPSVWSPSARFSNAEVRLLPSSKNTLTRIMVAGWSWWMTSSLSWFTHRGTAKMRSRCRWSRNSIFRRYQAKEAKHQLRWRGSVVDGGRLREWLRGSVMKSSGYRG